jgi:secreted trypsin-like serine protease
MFGLDVKLAPGYYRSDWPITRPDLTAARVSEIAVPARIGAARPGLALLVVLSSSLISAAPASGVAHGTLAPPGRDPFAVKLTMSHIPRPDGSFRVSACSAALISPTWILTAGHCFRDTSRNRVSGAVPYPTTATLNTIDTSRSSREVRKVVRVTQASGTDIALAQLSAPVTDVTPLALSVDKPVRGTILTLAGWGATSSTHPRPQTRLSLGQVQIRTLTSTTVSVVGYHPAADTSACFYDSGAPYFTTRKASAPQLVSIESNGPGCPHTAPETSARVDTVIAWVRATVADLPRPGAGSHGSPGAVSRSRHPAHQARYQ